MSRVLRVVVVILGIGVVMLLAYGAWLLLRRHWAPILFYAYLAVGTLMVATSFYAMFRSSERAAPLSTLSILQIAHAVKSRGLLTSFRGVATRICTMFALLALWPLAVITSFQERPQPARNPVESAAHLTLHSLDVVMAWMSLLLSAAGGIIWYFSGAANQIYAVRFLYLLVCGMLGAVLVYSIGEQSLPETLRRSKGSPVGRFALILMYDFAALLLALEVIIPPEQGVTRWQHTLNLSRDLVEFKPAVMAMWHGRHLTLDGVLLTLVGLVFGITIVEAARHLNDFKRTDADQLSIVSNEIFLGRFNLALRDLEMVKTPSAETHALRALALLAVGQATRAVDEMKTSLAKTNGRPATDDEVFTQLSASASFYRLPSLFVLDLIGYAVSQEVADTRLMTGIAVIIGTGTVDGEALRASFEKANIQNGYPMSTAFVLLQCGDIEGARTTIDALQAADAFDEIALKYLDLQVVVRSVDQSDKAAAAFEHWCTTALLPIQQEIPNISDNWQHIMTNSILGEVATTAQLFASPRIQQIEYIQAEARRALPKTQESEQQLKILDGITEKTRKKLLESGLVQPS